MNPGRADDVGGRWGTSTQCDLLGSPQAGKKNLNIIYSTMWAKPISARHLFSRVTLRTSDGPPWRQHHSFSLHPASPPRSRMGREGFMVGRDTRTAHPRHVSMDAIVKPPGLVLCLLLPLGVRLLSCSLRFSGTPRSYLIHFHSPGLCHN